MNDGARLTMTESYRTIDCSGGQTDSPARRTRRRGLGCWGPGPQPDLRG